MGVRYIFRLGLAVAVAAGLFLASGAPLPKAFQERVGNAVESGDINQAGTFLNRSQIGRASWRERVCQYGSIPGVGVTLKKKMIQEIRKNIRLKLTVSNQK